MITEQDIITKIKGMSAALGFSTAIFSDKIAFVIMLPYLDRLIELILKLEGKDMEDISPEKWLVEDKINDLRLAFEEGRLDKKAVEDTIKSMQPFLNDLDADMAELINSFIEKAETYLDDDTAFDDFINNELKL